MIATSQNEVKAAVVKMETGVKQVETGVQVATQAGTSLAEIIQAAQQVGDMITQIATAAEQQTSAAEQIKDSMESIAQITRESAAGAQQSAKASQDLSGLALNLQQLVGRFQLGNNSEGLGDRVQTESRNPARYFSRRSCTTPSIVRAQPAICRSSTERV